MVRDDPERGRSPHPKVAPHSVTPIVPYRWESEALVRALEGAGTLYNTYWIRLARGQTSFVEAVRNSRLLFNSAKRAGVQRIVHVSISKADQAPHLSYFAGKAEVEPL
jgi:uncharacterized protein YbjT (DUF2867 family)